MNLSILSLNVISYGTFSHDVILLVWEGIETYLINGVTAT